MAPDLTIRSSTDDAQNTQIRLEDLRRITQVGLNTARPLNSPDF